MKELLLISSCLLGNNTKYNGKNNYIDDVKRLEQYFDFITICPEMDGGLPCPRDPSEIIKDKVISNKQKDVTKEYTLGAKKALDKCIQFKIKYALLKEKSPSCGVHQIYDGTFTGTKISGSGITTNLLVQNGIKVFNENEINLLLNEINS